MRKALIRQANGYVENIIEIENSSSWQPPQGCTLIDALNASPGDTWNGIQFVKPILPLSDPPPSGHPAQLISINVGASRPARVKRVWQGNDYYYDCFTTTAVVTQYQAGQIVIGDWLWVEFLDPSEGIGGGEQIVIAKVFKSW